MGSEETRGFFKAHKAELKTKYDAWQSTLAAWKEANPEKAKLLQDGIDMKMPTVEEMFAAIPEQEPGSSLATRVTGAHALQGIAKACPLYTSGSADLHGSNMNYIKGGGDFGNPEMPAGSGKTYAGRNIHYGIREHAMGSIMNGIAYYGISVLQARPSLSLLITCAHPSGWLHCLSCQLAITSPMTRLVLGRTVPHTSQWRR